MFNSKSSKSSLIYRVDRCLTARDLAISFVAENLIDGETEAATRDRLLSKLKEEPSLLDSGWYAPPPDGISVLYGEADDPSRLDFDSLRKPEHWPNDENRLERETVGFVYMSPVDRKTGVIGDFNLNFYRGNDAAVRKQLKAAYDVTIKMCEFVKVGMEFRELFDFNMKALAEGGAQAGRMAMISDPSDINFGHTVPWSYELPTPDEQAAIDRGNIDEIRKLITAKRLYLNSSETFRVPETCAFTIEPRVATVDAQGRTRMACFHMIVAFRNGQKTIAGYDSLFRELKMDYMLGKGEDS